MAYVNLFNYVKYWWDNIKDVYLPANYASLEDFNELDVDVSGKVNVSDTTSNAEIDALFETEEPEEEPQTTP